MAQFVTHIQPTLVEASHHHIPHPHHHKDHHEKHEKHEKYEKHHKESGEHQQGSKDHHTKDKHVGKLLLPKLGHSTQHYPMLPSTPSHHHHEGHADHEHERDSGQYLDSHGIPHTYQLHFIDSQGIHRDFHGHVEDYYENGFHQDQHQEKESNDKDQTEKKEVPIRKAVPEDRSPFEKSPSRDEKRPTPPQFISLHSVHGTENKYQTIASIVGVAGACRKSELTFLRVENVEFQGQFIKVTIPNTKTKVCREFAITTGAFDGINCIEMMKKYILLSPSNVKHDRFFVKYSNGICRVQPVGINTFGNLPKMIAEFLKLPNPCLYTGHCFRLSSTTLLVDSGADILRIKQQGGWKSNTVAEGYVDNSITNKRKIATSILGETSVVASVENIQIDVTLKTALSAGDNINQ